MSIEESKNDLAKGGGQMWKWIGKIEWTKKHCYSLRMVGDVKEIE